MIGFLKQLINLNIAVFRETSFPRNLYLFGLLLMPLDSFPIFPTSNVYRPISFFPIFLYWAITLFRELKLKHADAKFLLILFVASVYTFVWSIFGHDSLDGFYKFVLNAFICFIFVSSTRKYIQDLQLNTAKTLEYISRVLLLASIIPLTLGWIQLFSRIGLFPTGLTTNLTSLFSYRVDISRIQWTSGEPSMGFRFISMTILFVILYYPENNWLKKIFLFSAIVQLLMSGSSFGYLFILLLVGFHLVFMKKINFKTVFKYSIYIVVGGLLFINILNFLPDYTQNRLSNISKVFQNLNLDTLLTIAALDGSLFLRLFNPVIGVIIAIKNFGFGIGGECYHFQYIGVINEYFPFALDFPSVQRVLYQETIITPKSLYAKIIAEFGVIGISIFAILLRNIYKKIKLLDDKRIYWLYAFMIVMILNTGSYIYFNFLFLLVLLLNITAKPKQLQPTI